MTLGSRSIGAAAAGGVRSGNVAVETARPDRAAKVRSGWFGTTFIFLVVAVALHIDNIILGKFSYVLGKDWLGFDTPLKMAFVANIEKSGALAYWFPNLLCGLDGTSGEQAFDLMILPYLFLPHWAASFLDAAVASFVAMVAMNALFKELDVDAVPAFLGALIFAIFPIVAPYVGLGIAGLPVIALVVRRTVAQPISLRSVVLWATTGIVISLASNFMLSFPFVVPLVALWMLALDPKRAGRIMLAFFVVGLCGIVVQAAAVAFARGNELTFHSSGFQSRRDWMTARCGPMCETFIGTRSTTPFLHGFRYWRSSSFLAIACSSPPFCSAWAGPGFLAPVWNALRAMFPGAGLLNGVNFRFQYATAFFVVVSVAVLLDAIGKAQNGAHGRRGRRKVESLARRPDLRRAGGADHRGPRRGCRDGECRGLALRRQRQRLSGPAHHRATAAARQGSLSRRDRGGEGRRGNGQPPRRLRDGDGRRATAIRSGTSGSGGPSSRRRSRSIPSGRSGSTISGTSRRWKSPRVRRSRWISRSTSASIFSRLPMCASCCRRSN